MRGTHRSTPSGVSTGLVALGEAIVRAMAELAGSRPVAVTSAGPLVAHASARHVGAAGVRPGPMAGVLSVGNRRHTSVGEPDPTQTWALVERAQSGDGEAFGQLYDHYVDAVYRFIYYRVHDRSLAEDLTSETFLRALRRITSVQYQGRDIGAWFMTIARNLVFDHSKAARTRLEVVTGESIEPAAGVDSTETTVMAGLTAEQLINAVNKLGDEQRECIVLRFIQGLSVGETAEVMGKREGAIKAMQHRAVKRLATLLADDGLTPEGAPDPSVDADHARQQ